LDKLIKLWKAAIYAFFGPLPDIEYNSDGHMYHSVRCLNCPHKITCYPDTADAGSTGALWCHIWKCWGNEVLAAADAMKDLEKSCDIIEKELMKQKLKNRLIVTMLKRFGSKIILYSTHPHTKMESLMRTSHPQHYIPDPTTVSCDTKTMFARTHNCISKYLRKFDGMLSFATNAWTSPNHCGYVALTIHFVHENDTPT
ncbi:hypothetical protein ARMGADRAFT_941794, partial [Armillaria gallica]